MKFNVVDARERALLRAIRERPGEPNRRLAYADWLYRRGREEEAAVEAFYSRQAASGLVPGYEYPTPPDCGGLWEVCGGEAVVVRLGRHDYVHDAREVQARLEGGFAWDAYQGFVDEQPQPLLARCWAALEGTTEYAEPRLRGRFRCLRRAERFHLYCQDGFYCLEEKSP